MKATQYNGDKTFSIIEKEIEAPAKGEVRIQVAFVGVCGTDVHIYHGMMDKRVNIPVTIGHEMSGVVDALGEGVTEYEVGDKVVVRPLDDRLVKESDKGFNHICEELKFIGIDSPGAMQECIDITLRCRKLVHNGFKRFNNPLARLGRDLYRLCRIDANHIFNLLRHAHTIGRWQINFIENWDNLMICIKRMVHIRERLRLNPL